MLWQGQERMTGYSRGQRKETGGHQGIFHMLLVSCKEEVSTRQRLRPLVVAGFPRGLGRAPQLPGFRGALGKSTLPCYRIAGQLTRGRWPRVSRVEAEWGTSAFLLWLRVAPCTPGPCLLSQGSNDETSQVSHRWYFRVWLPKKCRWGFKTFFFFL